MCRSCAGNERHTAKRDGSGWTEGTGPAGAVPWGNTLLAFRFRVAVAHGNRTHRGRLSAPATGFEDRASHQIRKRYRVVCTLEVGQTDNILWVWCRAGAIELHEPSVGELVRAPFLRRQVRVALRHLDGRVPHPDLHLAK